MVAKWTIGWLGGCNMSTVIGRLICSIPPLQKDPTQILETCLARWRGWPRGPVLVARWPGGPGGPGGPVAPVAAGPCSSPRARGPWSWGRARGPVLVARDRDSAFARQSHFTRLLTWFEWFPTTIEMLEFVTRPQKYRGLTGRMRSPSAHTVFTIVT